MKIKSVRKPKDILTFMLVVDLYVTRFFESNVVPDINSQLAINPYNRNLYTFEVYSSPFLKEEEFELDVKENNNDYSRKLIKKIGKESNTNYNNNYSRKSRNALKKPNYFVKSRNF